MYPEALSRFGDFPAPWFVCGGYAIDMFLGKNTRERADLDIGIFRADQGALYTYFRDARFFLTEQGSKKPWQGEYLQLPMHEIHFELGGVRFEVLLNEREQHSWIYRRNAKISRSLDKALLTDAKGISYLSPEIVLLYKSKHLREKDFLDYYAVSSALSDEQRSWLSAALRTCYPQGHCWIE